MSSRARRHWEQARRHQGYDAAVRSHQPDAQKCKPVSKQEAAELGSPGNGVAEQEAPAEAQPQAGFHPQRVGQTALAVNRENDLDQRSYDLSNTRVRRLPILLMVREMRTQKMIFSYDIVKFIELTFTMSIDLENELFRTLLVIMLIATTFWGSNLAV